MPLQPLYEQVVVRPIEAVNKTAGGLLLSSPEHSQQYSEGEVVSVGVGYRLNDGNILPLKVKVGDIVVYRKGVEVSIKYDLEDLMIISEANVLAIKA